MTGRLEWPVWLAAAVWLGLPLLAAAQPVGITAELPHVEIRHQGQTVRIERVADAFNEMDPNYVLTSRPCPPFCIQPMRIAEGVETIGELELIDYLKQADEGVPILVIDSRDGDWPRRSGMIPGAISIPWQELHPEHTESSKIADILELQFGVAQTGALWNFENSKTLVFYCNGPWCGQSSTNIKQLLAIGYPARKIKWYRGGIQDWKILGLTTITP
jgi:rhodanese-related sulfurtransferase